MSEHQRLLGTAIVGKAMLWKKSGYVIQLLIVVLFTHACIERYDLIGERNNGSDSDVKSQDLVLDVDTGEPQCKADTDCGYGEFCNKDSGECETDVCQPRCDGKCAGAADGCDGTCPTTDCDGCCDATVCVKETTDKSCGKDGAPCTHCQACLAGVCTGWWYDQSSGLNWQVMPTGGTMAWSEAKLQCSGLNLDGGGWRLPNIGELRSLIRGCPTTKLGSQTCRVEPGGCLDSTCNDGELCKKCSAYGGPGEGGCYWPDEVTGTCGWYWSSSPVGDYDGDAWAVYFGGGYVYDDLVNYNDYTHVRCVR